MRTQSIKTLMSLCFGLVLLGADHQASAQCMPPTITTQPQDRTINSGASFNLGVTATSTNLAYQWYRNNAPIPLATNRTYTKTGAQPPDSGIYFVSVSNCGGVVNSSNALVSVSDPPYVLMGLTNQTWRYEQSGSLPSPTWQSTTYNDSGWSSGRAILAFENNAAINPLINTTLALTNSGASVANSAYYFRTTFVLTNEPSKTTILSSNYFDDGAVVYLNGVEAFRFNMPAGPVGYGTLASSAATEGVFIVTNLPSTLFVQGTNVIAVEVHQSSLVSSDIAFGMVLLATPQPPSALVITNQPANITAAESTPATFVVGVSGTGGSFQWYRESNGIVTAVSGANLQNLTIPVVTAGDAGNYFVGASNILGTVYSAIARLTVVSDTNPPVLVDADGSTNSTRVVVTFSEIVNPATGTNRFNYRITNTLSGTALAISSAVLTNGTNVILTSAARSVGTNYILVANGIQDLRSNVIVTNSSIPIAAERRTVVSMNNVYRYYDPIPFFGDNPDLGTQWKEPGYNDAGAPWGNGSSVFYFGPDDGNVPGTVGSHLDQSDAYISYYRARFDVDFSPGNVRLFVNHIIDDGAAFYLNGSNVLRVNLPDGPIPYRDPIFFNTPAVNVIGALTRTDPVPLPGSLVVTGQNVWAVSLHQVQLLDLEKAYGSQLDARVLSYINGPVLITSGVEDRTVFENEQVILEATTVAGSTFQWQQNSNNIAGAIGSSYTIQQVPLSLNGAKFRVVVSNSTSTATSSNGTLRVIADTNAPTVLSAILTTSNNTVQILYSEAMSASATTLANYRITNSLGQVQSITGATIRNGTNVTLTVNASGTGLRLVINGVRDIAAAGNTISNLVVALGINDLAVARTGDWKYLVINTNEVVQTNYYRTNYDDSTWSGPSPSVLHVEPGGLAAGWTKGTQVSPTMYELVGPGVSNFYNTVYFRKTISTPAYGGTVRLRGTVLYDDGVVLYLNGVELTRINMPGGTITAATVASAGHENTDSLGTFDITVTNWIPGNNILAAEVHQNAFNSSDMVFGLELTASIPSQVVRQPVPVQITSQPLSRSVGTNANVAFSVNSSGDPSITYQWSRNGVDIQNASSATLLINNVRGSDAGTYQVRMANSFSSATSQVATLTVTNASGGGSCTSVAWTNSFRLGTNELRQTFVRTNNANTIVLKWTNPVTNSCGSNATVILQRALTLGATFPVPATLWTNIYTNFSGAVTLSNTVSGNTQAYYRLVVP